MGICIIYLMIVLIAFGVFELKNNKVCFKYEFMDKQFTKVMKGIALLWYSFLMKVMQIM